MPTYTTYTTYTTAATTAATGSDWIVQFREMKMPTFTQKVYEGIRGQSPRQGTPKMNSNLSAAQKKDTAKINEAMEFCVSEDESSYVILVAFSKDGANDIKRIDNRGKIVGTFVYDQVKDQYHVSAVATHKVGVIPISYLMRLKDNPTWHAHVPMPENVILEYLSSKQKHGIESFKEKMGGAYSYHYVHFTGYF